VALKVSGPAGTAITGREAELTIPWLAGENHISTDEATGWTLARAIALDRAGLVLYLSEVEFLGVSTPSGPSSGPESSFSWAHGP
jgi:hypothetical protein